MLNEALRLHQHQASRLTTAPAAEPVTAAEMRAFTRATATQLPDADAEALIETARQWIEDRSGMAMIDQTWTLTIDRWPGYHEPWWDGVRDGAVSQIQRTPNGVDLPRYPLSSITSVTTYAADSTPTVVTVADVFDVDAASIPGRMTLQSGQVWPVVSRPSNGIEIAYVAGYGATGASVPAPVKQAVLRLAGYLFDNRGGCDAAEAYRASGACGIMGSYRVKRI